MQHQWLFMQITASQIKPMGNLNGSVVADLIGLMTLVSDMRDAQKSYFARKSRRSLQHAKALESQLDQTIKQLEAKHQCNVTRREQTILDLY